MDLLIPNNRTKIDTFTNTREKLVSTHQVRFALDIDRLIADYLQEHSQEISSLKSQSNDVQQSHLDPEQGLSDLEEGFYGLEEGFSDFEQRLSDLEKGVSDLEKGFSDLKKGFSDLKKGVSDLEKGVSDLEQRHSDLEKGHYDLQNQLRGFQSSHLAMYQANLLASMIDIVYEKKGLQHPGGEENDVTRSSRKYTEAADRIGREHFEKDVGLPLKYHDVLKMYSKV